MRPRRDFVLRVSDDVRLGSGPFVVGAGAAHTVSTVAAVRGSTRWYLRRTICSLGELGALGGRLASRARFDESAVARGCAGVRVGVGRRRAHRVFRSGRVPTGRQRWTGDS